MIRDNGQLRIVALTDVALGYGSPQILHLLRSLLDTFAPATCLVIEPDQKGRPQRRFDIPDLEVKRINTHLPPYDRSFQIEFNRKALRVIDAYKPDIVLATHAWVLPAALAMPRPPKFFMYYMLESVAHQVQGVGEYAVELNRQALGLANLVVVPERRRARADLHSYGWALPDLVEVYNVGPTQLASPPRERKRRILYAGSLGTQTMCERFLEDAVAGFDFDIAGPADTEAAKRFIDQALQHSNIRYLGFLPSHELAARRPHYAYTVSMWRPDNINQLFASPNKFFESIAAGVPPIVTPHPQCADIISRYDCGHLVMNWTMDAFTWSLSDAFDSFDRRDGRYLTLVENCLDATQTELNWEAQFAKVRRRLPSREALMV